MPASTSEVAVSHRLTPELVNARAQTDALFSIVAPDSLYERPIAERHRIVFYIGHLEAFDWNLLHEHALGLKSFHPEFDRLFAFGIDPVDGGLPSDQPSQWPAIDAVRDYVEKIRAALDEKLQGALDSDFGARDGFPLATLLNVAVEHRLMHAETLAYMLHQLPFGHKIHQEEPASTVTSPVDHSSVEIPAGAVTLGLPRGESFGWDNEFEAHAVHVPAFSIDKYKVTNQQYLEFMDAGGYDDPKFWAADDWNWKSKSGISQPSFWKRDGDRWLYRTMFNDVPLPSDWPVYVSQAEAKAYAKWVGKSLPTEAEWQRAAYSTPGGEERQYPWGSEAPTAEFGNFDFGRWSPAPVNAYAACDRAFGVHGMGGQWMGVDIHGVRAVPRL